MKSWQKETNSKRAKVNLYSLPNARMKPHRLYPTLMDDGQQYPCSKKEFFILLTNYGIRNCLKYRWSFEIVKDRGVK
jgi:hypothetical protein